jgi:hypothetical protein
MTWSEVRQHFPEQWLLVEATRAHSEANRRILDELAVLDSFPTSKSAMESYLGLHRQMPQRELFVLHTSRENLDIEEIRWLGIRGVG